MSTSDKIQSTSITKHRTTVSSYVLTSAFQQRSFNKDLKCCKRTLGNHETNSISISIALKDTESYHILKAILIFFKYIL